MKKAIITFLAIALAGGICATEPLSENEKIEKLILYIENLQGAIFIRNGSEYTAKEAANHLRLKRGKAGDRIKSANDFIEGIATKSYFSGKQYKIRFADGTIRNTNDILKEELLKIESSKEVKRKK